MKTFHLPLLAALPTLLASCSSVSEPEYQRNSYANREECLRANNTYIEQGVTDVCTPQNRGQYSGGYFGPWFSFSGGMGRVVGYNADGSSSRVGHKVGSTGRIEGRFNAPTITRGGFSTGSRSAGKSSSRGGFGG